ncbi:hypothetical protein BB560_001090 [Smittium megazygosporum]|uniref:NADH dehydrogenase [ubiquinone] 1 beta subcomplex subunit 7 n=1 Tax=Smittium megazygosporum TaxID=133381 RepID=A0A2T9ZII3_9FUNG|nr:hypothetical protein BB560_001090 [Smittium megazygosporum]
MDFSKDPDFQEPVMIATQQEMAEARIPLAYRDYCAHLLIPLNRCRIKNLWMPWACNEERHAHEKCEYEDFLRRSRIMTKLREAKKSQESQESQESQS